MNYAAFRQWYYANRPGDVFDVNTLQKQEVYELIAAAQHHQQYGYNVTWCLTQLHKRLSEMDK